MEEINDTTALVADSDAEVKPEAKAEKPRLSDEEEYEQLEGRLKRLGKKLGKETAQKEGPKATESSDFSHGEKALLRAIGIKGADELQLARDYIKRTGEDIDALEGDEIFQARLEKLRTTKANELAATSPTNRGNQGANSKESAEYWLAKLGPNDSVPSDLSFELRQKIVQARRQQSKAGKMFYSD